MEEKELVVLLEMVLLAHMAKHVKWQNIKSLYLDSGRMNSFPWSNGLSSCDHAKRLFSGKILEDSKLKKSCIMFDEKCEIFNFLTRIFVP